MNREAIYTALFDKLKNINEFVTTTRGFKHWSDVAQPDQPAMLMVQRTEIGTTTPGLNTSWLFHVDVIVYANTGEDNNHSSSSIINPLVDAITAALAPDPITNKCTLGGLVQHAWIEGTINTDEGLLGAQGFAMVPIVVKVV